MRDEWRLFLAIYSGEPQVSGPLRRNSSDTIGVAAKRLTYWRDVLSLISREY